MARGGGVGGLRAKALWLVEAGLPEQALAQAALVLKQSPDDGAALWARARALLALGRGAEAQRELAPLAAPARADLAARAARALRDAPPPGTASR